MNSAASVDNMVANWKKEGWSKSELIVKTAEAELGWPYVWGAVGALCTPDQRRYYAGRSNCPDGEKKIILAGCQVTNGSKSSCDGCTYFPGGARVLIDDCQGFVKQVGSRFGISFTGGGCTSMWKDDSNWSEKGEIGDIPLDKVCCVFIYSKKNKNMSHIGWHIGGGNIIHCSKTVKRGKISDKGWGWSHYAIPKGLGGDTPMPWRPTIRRGSTGDDVKYCQELLLALGYDLGPSGADGKFGARTQAAVILFQKSVGLNPDGVVGPLTWNELEKAVDPGEKLYTVCIPHLDKTQADAMKRAYPNCIVTEESNKE